MKLHRKLIFIVTASLFSLLLINLSCKKEEKNPWIWCSPCEIALLAGEYSGKATHYKYIDSLNYTETPNLDAYLNLGVSGSNVSVQCGIVNIYSASYFGHYQNTHYIEITGSFSRLSSIIWRRGEELKIVGTSRKFDSSGNTIELIDFEVIRK